MSLGENIYRLRIQKNMSQGGLADALEVSRQSVSKWENDSAVPELEKLIKMAQIFDVTIDELVTGKAKETPAVSPALQEEPRVIYIEKPARPAITSAQIIGIIVLCFTLVFLLLSIFVPKMIDDDLAFDVTVTCLFLAAALLGHQSRAVFWCCISAWLLGLFLLLCGAELNLMSAVYSAPTCLVWIGFRAAKLWKNHNDTKTSQ